MPLIVDIDEYDLQPHERYAYCTNVDLTTDPDGFAVLTILFTSNGSRRYPVTFRIDTAHLDDFFWRFGGGVELERRYNGHIYISPEHRFHHCFHCGLNPAWNTW